MEAISHHKLHLVSGSTNLPLAEAIADCLGVKLGETNMGEFANGEIHCQFGESVRGTDIFILQSHGAFGCHTINDAVMQQILMVDAAKRASAQRITAVCPFFGYARQDRKAAGREPISAKLMANLFQAAGADRIISVDLHSGQIQGFFDGPWDHLTAMPILCDYFDSLGEELVVASPDAGRVRVAERYASVSGADLAIVYKRRSTTTRNSVEAREVVGEVKGRTCVLIDDMIDTGGTLTAAAEQLMERGAAKVCAAATHGVFSGPATERLSNSVIEEIVVTNTLPIPPEKQFPKLKVLSVAPIIADAIDAIFGNTSVSDIFGGQNLT